MIYFFKIKKLFTKFKLKLIVTSFSTVLSLENKTKRINVIEAIKWDLKKFKQFVNIQLIFISKTNYFII